MSVSAGRGAAEVPGVPLKPKRRVFSAEYKLRILAEYEAAPDGSKGAVLRREGLYSSHVIEWRNARDAGALAGVATKRRGPAPKRSAAQIENAKLRAENERLAGELGQTKEALEVMGKAHALLGMLSKSAEQQASRRS